MRERMTALGACNTILMAIVVLAAFALTSCGTLVHNPHYVQDYGTYHYSHSKKKPHNSTRRTRHAERRHDKKKRTKSEHNVKRDSRPCNSSTSRAKALPGDSQAARFDNDEAGWKTLNIRLEDGDNENLYSEARRWLGVEYRSGGNDRNGVDCSGLATQIYLKIYDVPLHRNTAEIFEKDCTQISIDDLDEGDLVFFDTAGNGTITHVGIYLKHGKFIHASSHGVMINDLSEKYYSTRFFAAGRPIARAGDD